MVSLGTSGLRITETDSYVLGEESYRTDVTVANLSEIPKTAILYRAGDCFLQNSDFGFGSADPSTGAVSCVAGVDDGNGNTVPGPRIEQWFPLSAGSHYLEDDFGSVWAAIGAQTSFTDTCVQCANYVDNGAGLSWDLTLPVGGSATRSHLTVFSPLGRAPLSTTKTADSATAASGGTDGYTITIHNPNAQAVSLDAITDTLPDGFTYQTGSTTGATTSNPSISGQQLSWSGPISVPASGERRSTSPSPWPRPRAPTSTTRAGSRRGTPWHRPGTPRRSPSGGRDEHARRDGRRERTGTVTSSPAGIDCGTTCSATFATGRPWT